MIALLGKIHRRLEARDEIEQRGVDFCDGARQRALQLVEGRARLERRHRVDEIGHGFGLQQIDAPVHERAQRELARFRQTGASVDRRRHDALQHHRASMRAHLNHFVTGVRSRRREVCDNHLIDRVGVGPAEAGHCRSNGGRNTSDGRVRC